MSDTSVVERPLEIGERVRYRSLVWEVAEVGERSLTLFGREAANRGRSVQPLNGYERIERVTPPPLTYRIGERQWSDADWRAMHDAYRLTLAQGRGSLGTASWGRLVLEPYQLVPLQRIEQLPEPRLLIADDMGPGKTSEAGLILSRLLQRRRADRVLVVTRARPEPERWRDELLEKFGVDLQVINDGADYARLRRTVPSHLNLLTATPHDGKVESFASLVELADPYAVADRSQLQPRLVRPLIVRRLKSHVVRAGAERFVEPVIQVIDVEPDRLAAERHLERGSAATPASSALPRRHGEARRGPTALRRRPGGDGAGGDRRGLGGHQSPGGVQSPDPCRGAPGIPIATSSATAGSTATGSVPLRTSRCWLRAATSSSAPRRSSWAS